MERIKLSECQMQVKEEDIPGNFTSVRGAYQIPSIGKLGFYKSNGCMIDAPDDADLRELLASKIMEEMGYPHADVYPVYDDISDSNGCMSISILGENEEFVNALDFMDSFGRNPENSVKDVIRNDLENVSRIPGVTPEILKQREAYLVRHLFMSAVLSNTDISLSNMQVVRNTETGELRNPEYYDAGLSFVTEPTRYFFNDKTSEDLLAELYAEYPEQAAELGQKAEQVLTPDKIKELMSDSIYNGFGEETKEAISSGLTSRVNTISRLNNRSLEKKSPISVKDIWNATKSIGVSLKDKVLTFLNRAKEKILGKENEQDNGRN